MKIGLLGVGSIGRRTAPTLAALEETECYAVASRSRERAAAFAAEHGFQRAYGSYEELAEDPEVELVYIATPHALHFRHMMLCLSRGKHVLCEKAFTLNAGQARRAVDYARSRGLFLAEAMWPRYMPSRGAIRELLESGVIGTPSLLLAELCSDSRWSRRIMDPALGGGALLDLGVYGLNFALTCFGTDVERVASAARMTDTGVDAMETIALFYRDGRTAALTHGICAESGDRAVIGGDRGRLEVECLYDPRSVSVYDSNGRLLERREIAHQISGYEHQFREVVRCIRAGKTESESMPLSESLRLMELADAVRRRWGMRFPQEDDGTCYEY